MQNLGDPRAENLGDPRAENTEKPIFQPFPKIARINREMVITEKIDGTCAVVHITTDFMVHPGSRNRWLSLSADNFGFAHWVYDHQEELKGLGPGYHHGEWWGSGIQRRYGLDHKRFSLFNVYRWSSETVEQAPPKCCHVVPTLYTGEFNMDVIESQRVYLRNAGSKAAPGFMEPEGVVIYHTAARSYFKYPFKDVPKKYQ